MKKFFSAALVLVLFTAACSKDDDGSNNFDGSMDSISEFVGSDLLDTIVGLGMTINTGDNPPNIEGAYLISPNVLESSNVDDDYPGKLFLDHLIEFKNQRNLNIDYFGEQGGTKQVGEGSLLSGNGKMFSVFFKVEIENFDKDIADVIYIFSGEISSEGIRDIKKALFMVDNRGNSGFLENGEGRIFVDGDGLAENHSGGLLRTIGGNTELSDHSK